MRSKGSILIALVLLAPACGNAVPQSIRHGRGAKRGSSASDRSPAVQQTQPSRPTSVRDPEHTLPVALPGSPAPSDVPVSTTFSSSFDGMRLAEPKLPEAGSSTAIDLASQDEGASQRDPASGSAGSRPGLIPGWAWFALALGVVAGAFALARSSHKQGGSLLAGWLLPRCPYCQNSMARPSLRRTAFESWVLPFLLIAPLRCLDCRRRYYSLVFFARGQGQQFASGHGGINRSERTDPAQGIGESAPS